MDSIENSYEYLGDMQLSLSVEDKSFKQDTTEFELSKNFNISAYKDESMQRNFNSLESDLQLLSKEIKMLRQANSRLKSKLAIALHEKEIHLESHAKEISKLAKENRKLKEQLENGLKEYKKDNEILKNEMDKMKDKYNQLSSHSEKKIKKYQQEFTQLKTSSFEKIQRKDKEINVIYT